MNKYHVVYVYVEDGNIMESSTYDCETLDEAKNRLMDLYKKRYDVELNEGLFFLPNRSSSLDKVEDYKVLRWKDGASAFYYITGGEPEKDGGQQMFSF